MSRPGERIGTDLLQSARRTLGVGTRRPPGGPGALGPEGRQEDPGRWDPKSARSQRALGTVALLELLARPAPAGVVAADLLGLIDPALLDRGQSRLSLDRRVDVALR